MPLSPQCEAGCMSFDGGEVKHRRECVYYPESLTKLWHDTEAAYVAEIERLRAALEQIADTDPDAGTSWFHDVANAALSGESGEGKE